MVRTIDSQSINQSSTLCAITKWSISITVIMVDRGSILYSSLPKMLLYIRTEVIKNGWYL